MKENIMFDRMMTTLSSTFFIAEDGEEAFPIIELGPYNETDETFSLVYLLKGTHPQHIHDKSDAKFYFHSGKGVVIIGNERTKIPYEKGSIVSVPKGVPHGFEVEEEGIFMAWQSKSITDHNTGIRDIRFE